MFLGEVFKLFMKSFLNKFRSATANEIVGVLIVVSLITTVVTPYFLLQAKAHRITEQKMIVMQSYAAVERYVLKNGIDELDAVWVLNDGCFEKRYAVSQADIRDMLEDNIEVYHYDDEKGYFVGDCVVRTRLDEQGNITEHRVFTQKGNFTSRIIPGDAVSYKKGNQIKTVW